MNLFEIDERITRCFVEGDEVVDVETGEIFTRDYLDALEMARDEKVRNIALFIKNLESDAEQLKAQSLLFAKRQSQAEKKAKKLKKYLASFLDGESIKAPEFVISWRKSKAVVIDDESKLSDEYFRIKREPDKKAIHSALALFGELDGAHIEERNGMIIN